MAAQSERPECDLVMKGGITSGIVYPRLVAELSGKYRFRQVGGASAGAIAAIMTAAAQSGQLRGRGTAPFDQLKQIPLDLARDLPYLFQPSPDTATAFDLMMAAQAPARGKVMRALAVVGLMIRRGFGWFLLGMLASMIPAAALIAALLSASGTGLRWGAAMLALVVWLPVALIAGVAVSGVQLSRAAVRAVEGNGFGICDGHTRRSTVSVKPLTDWIDDMLLELVGPLDEPDRPVCFKDLWGEAASAAYRAQVPAGTGEAAAMKPAQRRQNRELREVDCLVMTTDLSHQRPFRFPFDTAEFFWCDKCGEKYFTDRVLTHMKAGRKLVDISVVADPTCSIHPGQPLYFFPSAPDVPLVIAARISLSFPGLISAVPLQAVDRSRAPGCARIVTVWFSDGGITSNFPIRFFDSAWPRRPTFGISLAAKHPDYPETMVWRPKPGASGRFLRYTQITSLSGFISTIFNSARNWPDSLQMTMPGFRDRVVEIRQAAGEGGMNLQMPEKCITALADRGREAGQNLLDGDNDGVPPFNFGWHRWVRHRNAMAGLDEMLSGMYEVWDWQREFLDAVPPPPPTGFPRYAPGSEQTGVQFRESASRAMKLAEELKLLGHPAAQGDLPKPEPELRLVPPV